MCSHLMFAFSRTGRQRSKKNANADVTYVWTVTQCLQLFEHKADEDIYAKISVILPWPESTSQTDNLLGI